MKDTLFESDSELSEWSRGLNYFYNFSKLIASKNASPRKIYQGVVDLIPPAWQYPEITCAKLVIDGHEFSTKNFKDSKWQQKGDITINNTKVGFLTVGYLLKKPEADEGPFLNEERYLLNLVCERVAQFSKHQKIVTMLQETDVKYRTLVNEVNDGIYICDLNGTFIYANRALAFMLGFERSAAIIGKRFVEFLSPEKAHVLTEQYRTAMSTGISSELITTEVIKQDGTSAFIEIKPAAFIKSGKLMGSQGVVRDITERRQAEIKFKHLSTHDSITGLYNRAFFDAEMKRLERGRQFPISIVRVDVENLKNVNDGKGHQDGDKLLKRVAQVLFKSFRGDDIVARIGKDEFAILLQDVDENTADKTIKRIQESLQEYNNNKSEIAIKLFFGAGTAKKRAELNSALKQADEFIYLEKKKNKIK
ncbi:MAG: diguanylate cyclase [Anaerolineaceae bacterium]|nr:diguanylate cyclase [Anaerolineaceae bacterium]